MVGFPRQVILITYGMDYIAPQTETLVYFLLTTAASVHMWYQSMMHISDLCPYDPESQFCFEFCVLEIFVYVKRGHSLVFLLYIGHYSKNFLDGPEYQPRTIFDQQARPGSL